MIRIDGGCCVCLSGDGIGDGDCMGGSVGMWGCVSIPYGGTCKKIAAMESGVGDPAVASTAAVSLLHGGDVVRTSYCEEAILSRLTISPDVGGRTGGVAMGFLTCPVIR